MNRLLLLALLLVPLVSSGQIYRSTDEHGNVTYSDAPPPGTTGEQVELRQTNTTPPPPSSQVPTQPQSRPVQTEPEAITYRVSITAPANDTTIPMGPGNFAVSASVQPALGQDVQLQLLVDGDPWGDPQQGTSWSLTNVFRGAHDLTVAVIGAAGKQLAVSGPIRVYVLRPSIINRNRN
jgi:Domain of unknown function (DUF4124)